MHSPPVLRRTFAFTDAIGPPGARRTTSWTSSALLLAARVDPTPPEAAVRAALWNALAFGRVRWGSVTVLVVLLAVVGCSDDGAESSVDPTPSSTTLQVAVQTSSTTAPPEAGPPACATATVGAAVQPFTDGCVDDSGEVEAPLTFTCETSGETVLLLLPDGPSSPGVFGRATDVFHEGQQADLQAYTSSC